jgi:hypothetical protein
VIPVAAQQSGWTTAAIATVVAAAVSGIIVLLTFWAAGVRQERSRRQRRYADALAALVAYREFAYVVRRRRAPIPAHEEIASEERVRISEALRELQRDLAFHTAWITIEPASDVAARYAELVEQTRRLAGGYMRDAWNAAPVEDDAEMNIADIDYSPLAEYETAYLDAVRRALRFWRVASPLLARS